MGCNSRSEVLTDKTRIDVLLRSWVATCPGPIYAWTEDECFAFVRSIIGDQYSLDEIRGAFNRLGYVPSYRSPVEGQAAHFCLQLPDSDWLRGRR